MAGSFYDDNCNIVLSIDERQLLGQMLSVQIWTLSFYAEERNDSPFGHIACHIYSYLAL